MNVLASLMENNSEIMLQRCLRRIHGEIAPIDVSQSDVPNQLRALFDGMIAALRQDAGQQRHSEVQAHGRPHHRIGFDQSMVVREYGILLDTVYGLVEEQGCALPARQARVITRFVAESLADAVSEARQRPVTAGSEAVLTRERKARKQAQSDRRKQHQIFMQVPVPVAILEGASHTFTFANKQYRDMVGRHQLLGRPLLEAMPELTGKGFDQLLDAVMATGEPYEGREVAIKFNGRTPHETGYFNFVYSPKYNQDGQIDGVFAACSEVTEAVLGRQRTERLMQDLRSSEERQRSVVEASGAGLWDLDFATGAIRADARMVQLMGLPKGSSFTLASGLASLPHTEERISVEAAVNAAFAGKNGGKYQVEFRTGGHGDAPERWVESRAQVSFDAAGSPRRLAGAMMDVTLRKQVEAERAQAQIRLEEQAQFEQQLIGIVSHDLRNPLSAIMLSAARLRRKGMVAGDVAKAVARIDSAAERANRLVRDLLDFTRARLGGGIPLEPCPAEMRSLVQGVLDEVEAACPNRHIVFVHSGDIPGFWDPDRIGQVVHNLVSNALKYGPEQDPIRVQCTLAEDQVRLQVDNGGAPIPPEKISALFEPFQRGAQHTDSASRSVGLGLYIVKQIVEAHAGQISVRSTHVEGTRFEVMLPLRIAT